MPLKSLKLLPILVTALVLSPSPRAQQKAYAEEKSQRGSVLRVDAGTLFTADGVPITLQHVNAKIVAHHETGQNQACGDSADSAKDDQSKSQVVIIQTGNVVLSSDSLTKLLDKKVGEKGKLKDLKFSTDPKKNEVHISGKTKKVIDVPFDLTGPVRATPNGQIELQAKSVKAADIPGLASLLGMTVEKAAGKNAAKGVKTNANTITFNPDQLWGLPVHGTVLRVTVQKNGLLLVFGEPGQAAPGTKLAQNKPSGGDAKRK